MMRAMRWVEGGLVLAGVAVATNEGVSAPRAVVGPYGVRTHAVSASRLALRLTVRGSSLSDIDCWVYDADDKVLASATDATSNCVLEVPAGGRRTVWIVNLGGHANTYQLFTKQTKP